MSFIGTWGHQAFIYLRAHAFLCVRSRKYVLEVRTGFLHWPPRGIVSYFFPLGHLALSSSSGLAGSRLP